MARLIQSFTQEIYSKDSYGQVSFAYEAPINRRLYEIIATRLSLLQLVISTFS